MKLAPELPPQGRFLLVQCCHLPQFFFLAERLGRLHPEWQLEALVVDHPQVRFYLQRFPLFRQIHYWPQELPSSRGDWEGILFPLLNRGYYRLKRQAARLPFPRFEVDYQGQLRPLQGLRLATSTVRPLHRPDADFQDYLERFPHRPLGEKILLVQSCHPSLLELTRPGLQKLIPSRAEIRKLDGLDWKTWRRLRRESFDSAVVFFSGEVGFARLKACPFLLGIPKVLVVNENGHFFYADWRSLLRFCWNRLLRGSASPRWQPRIIFFQTEAPPYVAAALQKLRQQSLYPDSPVLLLCRRQDEEELRRLGVQASYLPYPNHWRELWPWLGKLRDFDGDAVVSIFSGRSVFRKQKCLSLLLPLRRHLVLNARLDLYHLSLRTLPRIFRREPLLFGLGEAPTPPILLLPTWEDEKALAALALLRSGKVARPAPLVVFCSREKAALFRGEEGVRRVLVYEPGNWRSVLRGVAELRRLRPEVVAALFPKEASFRLHKLLFYLLPARHRLVFNRTLDCFYIRRRQLGLLARELLQRSRSGGEEVLLLQSGPEDELLRVVQLLQDPRVAAGAPIWLLCREQDAARYRELPSLQRVLVWRRRSPWRNLKLILSLVRRRSNVVAALFSGHPGFAPWKFLFFLLPGRNHLVFNARQDCYYLGWRTLPYLFRREARVTPRPPYALFLQSEEGGLCRRALSILQDPKVTRPKPIWVLCPGEQAAAFQGLPGVARVLAYGHDWKGHLKILRELLGRPPEVMATIFSGRPVFRLQKLLFFLLPARHRLVFNPSLDCFYLTWRTLPWLLRSRRRYGNNLQMALRLGLKAGLFLPRFLYLVSWVTYMKLRRCYLLQERPESPSGGPQGA